MLFISLVFRRIISGLGSLLTRIIFVTAGSRPGKGCRFYGFVYVRQPQNVRIGTSCLIGKHVVIKSEMPDNVLILEDDVQINDDVEIDHTGGLTVMRGSLISAGAVIYTHDHGYIPQSSPRPMEKTIGQHAWVGLRAILLANCRRVGAYAVIGAGAVVTKDVPDYAIVAGNPARVIGYVSENLPRGAVAGAGRA